MMYAEYFDLRREVLHKASDAMEDAARRNEFKDQDRGPILLDMPPQYRIGWKGFDLRNKLREEVDEVLESPTRDELGDVMWVCAMMLDSLKSVEVKEVS